MSPLFYTLEAQELTEIEKPVFNVLKASLYYPSTDNVRSKRLADDIVFFCLSATIEEDYEAILSAVWRLSFDMICCIPLNHACQDLWVNAIKELKDRGNLPTRSGDPYDLSWQELPCFLRELNEHMDWVYENDTEFQNLNSFAARLCAAGIARDDKFFLTRLRDALERPAAQSPEYLLSVASEWLTRCADQIHDLMKNGSPPERGGWWTLGAAFANKDVAPFSIGRWNLWKERISEERQKLSLSSNSETGAPVLAERLEIALHTMDETEKTAE
ncbi:hypothetical protein F5Y16DRAFT_79234 [Xylariaceae sp. FL0255]|nr:hypothetical protein F5Y16DRAFT_79234 [Xylariaceae sp. FL0255]